MNNSFENINIAKEWASEKVFDKTDINELLKDTKWIDLLKKSFDSDFDWSETLSGVKDSLISSLDLNNLDLSRWSSDVYALQIIWHIFDKTITIDGIVWNQTRWIIEKLKNEVWIDIDKGQSSIKQNQDIIKGNNDKIWKIDTQITSLDNNITDINKQINDVNSKILKNDTAINEFNSKNPDLSKKIDENKQNLKDARDEKLKIDNTKNIWSIVEEIFKWWKVDWSDLENINKLIDSKSVLKSDFPKSYDKVMLISNMLLESTLWKWYNIAWENDIKAIEALSKFVSNPIYLPYYSEVTKYTWWKSPFSIKLDEGKLKVYSTESLLSSKLWYIEKWKFIEDEDFFDQDNKFDNSDIDSKWYWWAAVFIEMKDEINEKKLEINEKIKKLEEEKNKLNISSEELKKLVDTKKDLSTQIDKLNNEKNIIEWKKQPLVQDKNTLTGANSKLEGENKNLEAGIKTQQLRDSKKTNQDIPIVSESNSSTTNSLNKNTTSEQNDSGNINKEDSSRDFNSEWMPDKVFYERESSDWKYTETYDISYANEKNDKWYINAQIDDWGENTHIMTKDKDLLKGFINHYQEFRDWWKVNIFSEWSDLFDESNKIKLWIDWAWDIKVVDIGSVSCITVQGGLLKDDFVIPLSYDRLNTDNLTLLNTIQDATWLDLSYTIEDNAKWIEWTLNWNKRSYDSWFSVEKKDISNWSLRYDTATGMSVWLETWSSYEITWGQEDWAKEFNSSDLFEWIPVSDQEIKTIDWKNYFYFEFDDSWWNEDFNKRCILLWDMKNLSESQMKDLIKAEVSKSQAEYRFLTEKSNNWEIKWLSEWFSIDWLEDWIIVKGINIEINKDKPWEREITIELESWSLRVSNFDIKLPYDSEAVVDMKTLIENNKSKIEEQIKKEQKERKEASEKARNDFLNWWDE